MYIFRNYCAPRFLYTAGFLGAVRMRPAEEKTAPGRLPVAVVHVFGTRRRTPVERARRRKPSRGSPDEREPGGVAGADGPRPVPGQEIVLRFQTHRRRHTVGHAEPVQRLE